MKVAIDARKLQDYGIGTYIRGLLAALVQIAEDERYVAIGPAAIRRMLPTGVEHVELEAKHYSVRELFTVGRAAERAGADLLHLPHYVVPRTTLPIVVTIHDLIHLHQPLGNPIAPLYARRMLRRAVKRASMILTVSDTVAGELKDELGADVTRVRVTPNGIDDRFRSDVFSANRDDFFLFVGNDKPHKGVDTLVAAFAAVRRGAPAMRLVLAGAPFERFSSMKGVERPGFISDESLADLYTRALAVIQPSREEGFGLPAAEGMASGAPVITSDAAALVELCGDAALQFHAGSIEQLTAAMMRVAREPQLRGSMISRGFDRAREFTWQRCAELTRRAYFDTLERPRH